MTSRLAVTDEAEAIGNEGPSPRRVRIVNAPHIDGPSFARSKTRPTFVANATSDGT